jgi:DNA-binding transcriptional LysR family regulator
MPSFISAQAVRTGRLQRVLPGWNTFVATLSALWPATHYTSPRVRAFIDAAVDYFTPPPWDRIEA